MTIMNENMIVIRDPQIFYFDFGRVKNVDENLKHEIHLPLNVINH